MGYIKVAFVFVAIFSSTDGIPYLLMNNNGPSVLDTNVTFFSSLNDYVPHTNLCYTFEDGIQNHTIMSDDKEISLTVLFPSFLYQGMTYVMNGSVFDCGNNVTIAFNYTKFDLKEYLIGNLVVNRDSEGLKNVDEVAVGENITMAIDIYDPNQYFAASKSDYMWSIDYEPQDSSSNNISYSYHSSEMSRISTVVSIGLSNNIVKYGYFAKNVTVKVPVNSVNVSGNPFIHHGEILELNISCNGSSPFLYCARPLQPSEISGNFSCDLLITSTTCNFHFQFYFRNYGNYHVGIFISNDVKTVKRVLEVVVYNVSKKPQLSTVIIPIVCSLLTLCIIAVAIAFYIQQRNQLTIEVANFDFQEDSVELNTSSTFFEKVFQACTCRVCNYRSATVETEDDEEDEPLLSSRGERRY